MLCGKLGQAQSIEYRIETDNIPIYVEPYRSIIAEKPIVEEHVKKMLDSVVITDSRSPYNAPLLMVPKKDGEKRFCINYRKLNAATLKDRFPIPRIDETLTALHGARYFSTLDLLAGYWQIPVYGPHRHKTAFTANGKHYEFNRMPFGLCNAPSTLQRLMTFILEKYLNQFTLVYLDDIIIYSATFADHTDNLSLVLDLLSAEGLRVKGSNCSFARKEVEYLGHIVSSQGIAPNPKKIEAIQKYPTPLNSDELWSFLGLINYYRRFVRQKGHIAHPLTELTKKNANWKWEVPEKGAFETLKQQLTSAPILSYPDFTKPFIVYTDASDYGIGAVLS